MLRNAALPLPVQRYQEQIARKGYSRIKVSNGPGGAYVSAIVYADETSLDRNEAAETEGADAVLAVLLAQGFNAHRSGHGSIVVSPIADSSQVYAEDVPAVIASSGLDITQPGPAEWHVAVGAKRPYVIRSTGKDAGTRYAVKGPDFGSLATKLRTMSAAIDIVKRDLGTGE
ncbi:hypothetical protein [Nocardia sp. NPDC057030]|uniref:hypothetical protein n=1 Tax=unclassified Nocardia TaxID=2637762 RepID=UPI00363DA783